MKFTCNQDWDSMNRTSGGAFCDLCKKNVRDFTSSSIETIIKEHSNKEDVCGLYNIEQVDPNIVAPVKDVFSNRFLVLITSLTLGLTTKSLQAQRNTPKVEQNQTTDSAKQKNITSKTIEKHVCDKNCECEELDANGNSYRRVNRRKLYFTKRLPFVRYKRHIVVGRFL